METINQSINSMQRPNEKQQRLSSWAANYNIGQGKPMIGHGCDENLCSSPSSYHHRHHYYQDI